MKYSLYHHNAMVDRGILDRTVNKSADLLQQSPNLSLSFPTARLSGTMKNMAENDLFENVTNGNDINSAHISIDLFQMRPHCFPPMFQSNLRA